MTTTWGVGVTRLILCAPESCRRKKTAARSWGVSSSPWPSWLIWWFWQKRQARVQAREKHGARTGTARDGRLFTKMQLGRTDLGAMGRCPRNSPAHRPAGSLGSGGDTRRRPSASAPDGWRPYGRSGGVGYGSWDAVIMHHSGLRVRSSVQGEAFNTVILLLIAFLIEFHCRITSLFFKSAVELRIHVV